MAKGKSSATSATRKKHARKAAVTYGDPLEPQVPKEKKIKGKEKGKKGKEPRKKVYIPPVKHAPVHPDPLDTLGIAQRIPAELLIVLRLLAKKDSVTKRRALEEFQADWVDKARREKAEYVLHALQEILPVWLHHVPALFLHPSRRIRLLAAGLHASLLKLPSPIPEQLIFTLHEALDADHAEYVSGAWCMAAHDIDRQVSAYGRESWDRSVANSLRKQDTDDDEKVSRTRGAKLQLDVGGEAFAHLWDFAQRTILDPAGVYTYVNPPPPVVVSPPGKHAGKGVPARLKLDDDLSSRSNRDEEEESETDRKARLRIGGFGAAEWILNTYTRSVEEQDQIKEFIAPLDNPALWSSLYHNQSAPFVEDDIEASGYNQPTVRRTAWAFLQSLLHMCKDSLKTISPTLSIAILRSAWVEPDAGVRGVMWQPLLTFLKEYPHAWELEAASNMVEDGSSDEEDETENSETPRIRPSESKSISSSAYQEFRQFLELGCMGSSVQGYPAIIIILSTIPSSILASVSFPVQTLFASFWAAVDGRALSGLDRTAASAAFLSSLLECILFITGRLLGNQGSILLGGESSVSPRETAIELLRDQVQRVWEELSTKRLKVEDEVAATSFCKFFSDLHRNDAALFDLAWKKLVALIQLQVHSTTSALPTLVPVALKVFNGSFSGGSRPREAARDLTSEVVQITISQFEKALQAEEIVVEDSQRLGSLIAVLNTFGDTLFADPELASAIDNTCLQHARRLLSMFPALLLIYLSHRRDEQRCTRLWSALLRAMGGAQDAANLLPPLLDAAESGQLAGYLRPIQGEMDDAIGQLITIALNSPQADSLTLVKRLLMVPDYFITPSCLQGLVSSLCTVFAERVQGVLRGEDLTPATVDGLLALLQNLLDKQLLSTEDVASLLSHVFTFSFVLSLLPQSQRPSALQSEKAQHLWKSGLSHPTDATAKGIMVHVKQTLRDVISDCSIPISTPTIVSLLSSPALDISIGIIQEILPGQAQLDGMLNKLPAYPSDSCLAVIDPLVLPGDWSEAEEWIEAEYDYAGHSVYSRIVMAFMACFRNDRHAARENVWALRHCVALALWAKDLLRVRSSQSPVFSSKVSVTELENVVSGARALCALLLAHSRQDGWLRSVIDGLVQGKPNTNADGVEKLLHVLIRPRADSMRESRILYEILEHILSDASRADADQIIHLARTLQKKAPHTSLAIILSVTKYAPEPPTLERYRNELAADLFGVPATKANSEGLWLLRRLVATAPDPESDIVFLPTPRAVNLMKACQQWITSDEDLDEEVECEMTSVFRSLAPILQNVPGSHWDLVFDVTENNLESSSFDEPSSLPVLSRTLELLITVQDLVTTNKALRANWEERKISILTLVRDLVAKKLDSVTGDVPLSVCRELALSIVQDLPGSLLDSDTISKMCHILTDPSDIVQRMAYKMLRESAAKYTEHLVLEAGVDSDAELKLDLPLELVSLLQLSVAESDLESAESSQNMFSYLLAWMLTFDLFTNASLKVRSGYMDHMRRTDLIRDYFLPRIFSMLRLYDGPAKVVKLDIWAVDEYYIDLYSSDSPVSLSLLAAHLYYRSLRLAPALIRGWLLDCRDRQLSTTVTTYTSTHFSPALLQAELMQVKTPDAAAEISDDNMKVKVANAVNEITASYAVDEYELEIRLKLPSDWPLHAIEIKDTKRVGVNEDRWRSWILGVQQILTFRSGSIVDGLAFFKKNVASHFEGQSECAICYSMISAMDGSLPKKPCRTCKNRFHAGCLYKWFNTSHSSSCPLCRSEIIQ